MFGMLPPCNFMRPAVFGGYYPVNVSDRSRDEYYIYKQIPVFLGGTPGTERIVIFSKKSGPGTVLQLEKFDPQSKQWVVEYRKEAGNLAYFSVIDGYWEAVRQNVVVIYYSQGSGGYLYYTVVGKKNGKPVELVNRKDIFQGDVWLENGKLYEQYGNRYRVWILRNGRLLLVPYKVPVLPGAVVIRYGINPKDEIVVGKKNYSVPVGAVVQIIRTDMNDVTERLLFSYTPVVKYLKHKSGFKFLEKGMLEATIIPEGYNWDKAVNIIVEAR